MWFILSIITMILWAVADIFYKLGNENDKYSHYKTGIVVGLVMGLSATIYLVCKGVGFSLLDILKYLPVSILYISSMIISYKGLRYLELSIISPLQNCSGVVAFLLLFIIFRDNLGFIDILGIIIIGVGVCYLSYLEKKRDNGEKKKLKKTLFFSALVFPLLYCVLDGIGTFLDAIYLDKLEIISEDVALIAYEYTFFIYGVVLFIYLKFFKKEEIGIFKVESRLLAAIFETAGQFFYVFAISSNSTLACPVIASYSIMSVLLSRVFLKEKLSFKEYAAITLVLVGIIFLGISEGIS